MNTTKDSQEKILAVIAFLLSFTRETLISLSLDFEKSLGKKIFGFSKDLESEIISNFFLLHILCI